MVEQDEMEIDLLELFWALWHRAWIIILATLFTALVALGITHRFIEPQYQADALFYVNNSSFSVGDVALSLSPSDISAAKSLVSTYIVILNSRSTLGQVSAYAGYDGTIEDLKKKISAKPVSSTEIFEVAVVDESPAVAERIATAITKILPQKIGEVVEGSSAKIVDAAVLPYRPISPSYFKNTVLGGLLGFLLSAAVIVFLRLFDRTIDTVDYLTETYPGIPLLAVIPIIHGGKGGSYRYYASYYANHEEETVHS